jgi:hypothetical protein
MPAPLAAGMAVARVRDAVMLDVVVHGYWHRNQCDHDPNDVMHDDLLMVIATTFDDNQAIVKCHCSYRPSDRAKPLELSHSRPMLRAHRQGLRHRGWGYAGCRVVGSADGIYPHSAETAQKSIMLCFINELSLLHRQYYFTNTDRRKIREIVGTIANIDGQQGTVSYQ